MKEQMSDYLPHERLLVLFVRACGCPIEQSRQLPVRLTEYRSKLYFRSLQFMVLGCNLRSHLNRHRDLCGPIISTNRKIYRLPGRIYMHTTDHANSINLLP